MQDICLDLRDTIDTVNGIDSHMLPEDLGGLRTIAGGGGNLSHVRALLAYLLDTHLQCSQQRPFKPHVRCNMFDMTARTFAEPSEPANSISMLPVAFFTKAHGSADMLRCNVANIGS